VGNKQAKDKPSARSHEKRKRGQKGKGVKKEKGSKRKRGQKGKGVKKEKGSVKKGVS
jgi:hypothetical protein